MFLCPSLSLHKWSIKWFGCAFTERFSGVFWWEESSVWFRQLKCAPSLPVGDQSCRHHDRLSDSCRCTTTIEDWGLFSFAGLLLVWRVNNPLFPQKWVLYPLGGYIPIKLEEETRGSCSDQQGLCSRHMLAPAWRTRPDHGLGGKHGALCCWASVQARLGVCPTTKSGGGVISAWTLWRCLPSCGICWLCGTAMRSWNTSVAGPLVLRLIIHSFSQTQKYVGSATDWEEMFSHQISPLHHFRTI